jgi:uncharacterized low-complexity protein
MKKAKLTPIATALGTTLAVSLSTSPMANAAGNPFSMNELSSGYMVAEDEGTCGAMEDTSSKEGESTQKTAEVDTSAEGKCGEGKCGERRKAHDGKCGEGKCGPNGPGTGPK